MAECQFGRCDGSGWLEVKDPHTGYLAYAECECLLQRERKARIERLLSSAEVPDEFLETRLDKLDRQHPDAWAASAGYVRNWPHPHGNGLLFVGDVGTGKSTLAYGVLNGLLERGVEGIAANGPRLLRDLGKGITDHRLDDRMDLLIQAPILLLDDMAAHRTATMFAAEHLFELVNERYAARRPSIYTAMYDVPQWGGSKDPKVAQLWRAIGSRVLSRSEAYLLDGPDRRLRPDRGTA